VKKPPTLRYGVNDDPPLAVTIFSGLQQVGIISIFLVYPLLVFREAALPPAKLLDILSLSMLAMSISVLLPALRRGPVGAGYLCPSTFAGFYLKPSLMAVATGSLPLVFGMTVFAGAVEAVLARLQRHLRSFFPPEIAGFVVLLLGVNIGTVGLRYVLGVGAPQPAGAAELSVAAIALATMVGLTVWTAGSLKMFSALVGMVVGYGAGVYFGVLDTADFARVAATPLLSAPALDHLGWSWDAGLAAPFAIAALAACLQTVGCVTTCQKINDADWVRPDMRSAERGVLADALGTVSAGLLGTVGVNASPTCVGVSGASGVTSRRVAYAVAVTFAALAFVPKAASILAIMPRPVIGAALLFSASFVFVNGLQIIATRLLDARRTFVIGLSFMIGFAADAFPAYVALAPAKIQSIVGSSLVLGLVCALALNVVFRLGSTRTGRLRVDPDAPDADAIEQFMKHLGAAWGARRDIIDRASFNLAQSIETIVDACAPHGLLEVEARFDEFNLDVTVSYAGEPLALPSRRPSDEEIMEAEEGQRKLAGYLVRRLADGVEATHHEGRSTLVFHFDH
jgi:NCS2 family nucleobase:cation symporter-2